VAQFCADGPDRMAATRACSADILRRRHYASRPWTRRCSPAARRRRRRMVRRDIREGSDEQVIDALEGEYRENFMLHYNFPPYATGDEAGRSQGSQVGGDVGHGKPAWAQSIRAPGKGQFPITIRVVSEINEFERFVVGWPSGGGDSLR